MELGNGKIVYRAKIFLPDARGIHDCHDDSLR